MTEYHTFSVDKFTFKVAADRLYSADGVWALAVGDMVRIGISDFLQQRSGDIAFVEMKPVGTVLAVGEDAGTVETIKVNIDLKSPAAGTIVRANPLMASAPEVINQDPYGEGWLCEIQAADWTADQQNMLDAPAYFARIRQAAESEFKNK